MHVRFSYQSELPRLPGTSRNKPHPNPWLESPAANSLVSLGRVADGPPAPNQNQQSLCTSSGLSRFERRIVHSTTRTVRNLVREYVFHPTRSATDRRTVRHSVRRSDQTVRFPNPDGPQLTVQHPFTHSCTAHLCTLCPVFIPQFSLVKACILLSLAIIARIHSMLISQTSFAFV